MTPRISKTGQTLPPVVLISLVCSTLLFFTSSIADPDTSAIPLPVAPPQQVAEYEANVPKTILELQQFRRDSSIDISSAEGEVGTSTLTELNPYINTWFLLTVEWEKSGKKSIYHLENPDPQQQLLLSAENPNGLSIINGDQRFHCDLWSAATDTLKEARSSTLPYAPLCEGRLYLRNRVQGKRTQLEAVTGFLRDNVWGSEEIIGFVKNSFYRDKFMEEGTVAESSHCIQTDSNMPTVASLKEAYIDQSVVPENLAISLLAPSDGLVLGCWYPVNGSAGIYVSAVKPRAISDEIMKTHRDRVSNLDSVESSAIDYMIAFDLDEFDLQFEIGTDHPRLGWSARPPASVRNYKLPGPDGIKRADPLITTGMVSPAWSNRTAAIFTGGFKRSHGAFRSGEFAKKNGGSHYGFIEHGTVFSKLHPGISTLFILNDGTVDIKTWNEDDNRLLGVIRHARQNGVPIIETNDETGIPEPGPFVNQWGNGNWSGSQEKKLRTLRSGACIQKTESKRFLIYGYFSTATPSAMARVFQAYGCRYAMQLDINALEHTYLAIYTQQDNQVVVNHLIDGMTEVDKVRRGELIPRFLGFPDNRDFFYLVRHQESE